MKLAHPRVIALVAALALAGTALAWRSANQVETVPSVSYILLDGQQGSTDGLRGKVVLVSFWATSCAACVAEMPQLVATHNQFKDRAYDTLAVAMRYDPPAYVAHFAASRQLPFGVAIDNTGEIARRLGDVQLTPTSVLIDKHGRIVERYVGAPDFAALRARVESLLAET